MKRKKQRDQGVERQLAGTTYGQLAGTTYGHQVGTTYGYINYLNPEHGGALERPRAGHALDTREYE